MRNPRALKPAGIFASVPASINWRKLAVAVRDKLPNKWIKPNP